MLRARVCLPWQRLSTLVATAATAAAAAGAVLRGRLLRLRCGESPIRKVLQSATVAADCPRRLSIAVGCISASISAAVEGRGAINARRCRADTVRPTAVGACAVAAAGRGARLRLLFGVAVVGVGRGAPAVGVHERRCEGPGGPRLPGGRDGVRVYGLLHAKGCVACTHHEKKGWDCVSRLSLYFMF